MPEPTDETTLANDAADASVTFAVRSSPLAPPLPSEHHGPGSGHDDEATESEAS